MRERTPLRRRFCFALALVLTGEIGLADAPLARAGSLEVSLSSHYSKGDYGSDEDVEIVYVPLELRYDTGLWSFMALVPWLRVSGGSAVVETDSGPITTKGGTTDGIGDLILEVQRSFEPLATLAPWITLRLRVKAPTASEDKGLGTGNFDVTPEVEFAQRYGPWTPFVTIGYRVLGDSDSTSYRDGVVASVGTLASLFGPVEAGIFLDWKQPASSSLDDSLEMLPMLRVALASGWTINLYTSVGFTDAVPDIGTGLELRYRFEDLGTGTVGS